MRQTWLSEITNAGGSIVEPKRTSRGEAARSSKTRTETASQSGKNKGRNIVSKAMKSRESKLTTTQPSDRFAPYYATFQELAKRLKSKDWCNKDWEVNVAYFGEGNRRIPCFGLQKKNWFNNPGGGIHFESWIGNADLERSAVPITLHVEASYEKTGIVRGKLYDHILKHGKGIIDSLEGYTVHPKSFQFLINRTPFTEATLLNIMERDYCKLARLAPIIDAAIESARSA